METLVLKIVASLLGSLGAVITCAGDGWPLDATIAVGMAVGFVMHELADLAARTTARRA